MSKFILVENTILNTDCIKQVYRNYEVVKHGEEFYDEDVKVEKGVRVYLTDPVNGCCDYELFQNTSFEEFWNILNGETK